MFQEYESSGKHMICDFKGIENVELLNNMAELQLLMKEINIINAAKSHKPFQPTSELHKFFLDNHLQKLLALSKMYPYINFEEELTYFRKN